MCCTEQGKGWHGEEHKSWSPHILWPITLWAEAHIINYCSSVPTQLMKCFKWVIQKSHISLFITIVFITDSLVADTCVNNLVTCFWTPLSLDFVYMFERSVCFLMVMWFSLLCYSFVHDRCFLWALGLLSYFPFTFAVYPSSFRTWKWSLSTSF